MPRVESNRSPKNGPLLGSSRMYCSEATVTKIATISRTPEKNRVNKSIWSPPKDTGEELVNPSHTVETRATAKPKIQTKGARPSFEFLKRRKPAGVASNPNIARLRNGVSESSANLAHRAPRATIVPTHFSTVGVITLPSIGGGYTPKINNGTRNAIRIRIE